MIGGGVAGPNRVSTSSSESFRLYIQYTSCPQHIENLSSLCALALRALCCVSLHYYAFCGMLDEAACTAALQFPGDLERQLPLTRRSCPTCGWSQVLPFGGDVSQECSGIGTDPGYTTKHLPFVRM